MKKKIKRPQSIEVEIPPYGQMLILGRSDDKGLEFFKKNWSQLWPKALPEIKRMYKACELGSISKTRRWLAETSRMEPDVFMSDKSDWHLRFDLDPLQEVESSLPVFDFFIRDTVIAHCQPVH
jgi:hypothetical protein